MFSGFMMKIGTGLPRLAPGFHWVSRRRTDELHLSAVNRTTLSPNVGEISHRQGEAMPERTLLENLWAFAEQRFQTLDLFQEYLKSVIVHWNDTFFLSIPVLPFVVWCCIGNGEAGGFHLVDRRELYQD